jgi:hypothetical protein
LIKYLRSSDYFNTKIINRTKKRLIELISTDILTQCENEMVVMFRDFMQTNVFNNSDAEMFLKAFGFSEEKSSTINIFIFLKFSDPFYSHFFTIAKEITGSIYLSEYATLYFLREIIKGKNQIYLTIVEIVNIFK